MLLAAVVLTVGCSDDAVDSQRDDTTVELFPYLSDYTEEESAEARTREATSPSWAPTGYYEFRTLNGVSGLTNSNDGASIGAFFTSGTNVELRRFGRKPSGDWHTSPPDPIEPGDYQLYGYVPYDAATSDITYHGASYADGAVLSLTCVNGVLSRDLCVIVGAKDGEKVPENTYSFNNGELKEGNFDCKIKSSEGRNCVFLLFDHLCSALRFRFRVDRTYAQLRTIKLKNLELTAYSDKACTVSAKQLKATITLQKTTDGTSPIVGGVEFTQDYGENSYSTHKVSICEGEEVLPSGDGYTDKLGFAPVTNATNYYMLYSKYDVYDKKGNLVRKNCVAENKIDVRDLFDLRDGQKLERGKIYTVKLTVEPTYLYVLSDPDLDSPTMTLE